MVEIFGFRYVRGVTDGILLSEFWGDMKRRVFGSIYREGKAIEEGGPICVWFGRKYDLVRPV